MKLLLLIVLNISFAYCDKTIWCYSGILNVDAEGQTNGIGKLIQGSITNPCVNATIVDANNKVGYLSFTLDFYQAFMKFYYSVIISDNVNLGCSAKTNLYPSSSTSKGYTEYCLCADNVCNIGSTSPTQNCLSERKGLDYVGISDVYGEVEACADVNDVCITATGNTDYSTVSYKGCLGNLEANLGKYINKAVTKDTEKCHEVPVTGALKTAYLNFCMCSDEFCNVNFNTATSQDCTELTVGFNIYGWQDSKKTTISCNINEPCGKIVAYDKGRWMSTQGCLSDLDPIIVKNNAISFPDNKCDKSNNKVDFQVVTGLDAQLCSCIGNCDYDAAPYSQCYSQSKGLDFIGISDYYNYFKEICTDNDSCYSVQTTGDNPFISFYGCSKVYNQFVAPHLVKPMTVTNVS
uniref:EB domain-containing protein n=1 Tax=Rhabditophanes sp. KR3021 TaxID=114890 RepID=A0AC35TY03_9BILA